MNYKKANLQHFTEHWQVLEAYLYGITVYQKNFKMAQHVACFPKNLNFT